MRRKQIGAVLMGLGFLLIITAITATVYIYNLQKEAHISSNILISQFRETYSFPAIDEKSIETKVTETSHIYLSAHEEIVSSKSTASFDGTSYIGILQIPSLDIELPVAESFSYESLKKTPCRYNGTVSGNDLVICAHNYSSHFGGISKLVNGDIIRLIDFEGNIFIYTVSSIEQIEPTNIDAVNTENYGLTLFTCNLSGNSRIVVKCDIE